MTDVDEDKWPLTAAYLRWDLEVLCERPNAVLLLASNNEIILDRLIRADKVIEQLRLYIKACTKPSRNRSPDYSFEPLMRLLGVYDQALPQ